METNNFLTNSDIRCSAVSQPGADLTFQVSSSARSSMKHQLSLVVLLLSVIVSPGCFDRTYDRRMATTIKVYEHYDLLDRNLAKEWSSSGVRLRVPKQFKLIPPPEIPVDSEGKPLDTPVLDLRQPDYLPGVEFPGLVGAWQASLQTDVGEETADQPGFLYVLTNDYLYQLPEDTPDRPDPSKFHEDFVRMMATTLRVQIEEKDWLLNEVFPKDYQYSVPVSYDATDLEPTRPISGIHRKFSLYLHQEEAKQVVIMLVLPEGVSTNEQLTERVRLMLETLVATGGGSGGGGTSSSGGGGGTGF